jgi:hypothetical protein
LPGDKLCEGFSEVFDIFPTILNEPPYFWAASSGVKNTKERIPGRFIFIILAIGFNLPPATSDSASDRIHVAGVRPIISAIAVGTAPIVATYVTSIVPLVGINVGVTLSLSFAEECGG